MVLSPQAITEAQVDQCLRAYPSVVKKAYERRIKDSRKQNEAVSRDVWRYEELPSSLSGGKAMNLAQLERLVQWKITHGHSRPFLPAMIRKNDASAVSKHTADAAKQLSGLNTDMAVPEALDTIMSAMDAASKLKGVGPATATLVLSAYNSENAPFFEDELYAWCLPEKAGSKLKYDKKEYREMFDRVWEVRKRLGEGVSMVHLEKAAFVLQHLDLAEAQDVQALETFAAEEADAGQSSHTANQDNKKHDDSNVLAAYTSRKRPAVEAVGSAKASEDKLQRRSKRAKP